MMKKIFKTAQFCRLQLNIAFTGILLILQFIAPYQVHASEVSSPVGLWVTIDDATHEPKSYVRIWEDKGTFYGRVEKILDPSEQNSTCIKCKGDKKDQPVQGMEIIWGMKQDHDKYDDGKILDPESGKVYSANMKLLDNGQKLEVRGYIGFSLIGRSQTWERKS